jgi:hypothetical protein
MLSRDEILARKKQQEELIMKGFVNNKTTSSKEEQDELPFSELRIEEDIEIDIQKKTYCETDNIEKGGKPAAIGEIRVWSGVKHVKHADGWVVIPKSKKAYLLDSSGKKHEKHSDEHENFGEKYRDEEHTKPEPKQEETPKQPEPKQEETPKQPEPKQEETQSQKKERPENYEAKIEALQPLLDLSIDAEDRVKGFIKLGVKDISALVNLTGASVSSIGKILEAAGIDQDKKGSKSIVDKIEETITASTDEPDQVALPPIDVHDRWESYEKDLTMVGMKYKGCKGLVAYGTGGVGKTWNCTKTLQQIVVDPETKVRRMATPEEIENPDLLPENERFLREWHPEMDMGPDDYDYITVKSSATPAGMYVTLYNHRDKTIIFDDCDSVFEDSVAINLIKAATDSSGKQIDWNSARELKTGQIFQTTAGKEVPEKAPKRFDFSGSVIVITNLPQEKLQSPLLQPIVDSRAVQINLTMSSDETLEMLDKIKDKMTFEEEDGTRMSIPEEDRNAAFDFIKKYKSRLNLGKLNARTLGHIVRIKMFNEVYNARKIAEAPDEETRQKIKDSWMKTAAVQLDLFDKTSLAAPKQKK